MPKGNRTRRDTARRRTTSSPRASTTIVVIRARRPSRPRVPTRKNDQASLTRPSGGVGFHFDAAAPVPCLRSVATPATSGGREYGSRAREHLGTGVGGRAWAVGRFRRGRRERARLCWMARTHQASCSCCGARDPRSAEARRAARRSIHEATACRVASGPCSTFVHFIDQVHAASHRSTPAGSSSSRSQPAPGADHPGARCPRSRRRRPSRPTKTGA